MALFTPELAHIDALRNLTLNIMHVGSRKLKALPAPWEDAHYKVRYLFVEQALKVGSELQSPPDHFQGDSAFLSLKQYLYHRRGELLIFEGSNSPYLSKSGPKNPPSRVVEAQTVDSLCHHLSAFTVHHLIIDCDSHSFDILKGATWNLSRQICTAEIHCSLNSRLQEQPLFWQVDKLMRSKGFILGDMQNSATAAPRGSSSEEPFEGMEKNHNKCLYIRTSWPVDGPQSRLRAACVLDAYALESQALKLLKGQAEQSHYQELISALNTSSHGLPKAKQDKSLDPPSTKGLGSPHLRSKEDSPPQNAQQKHRTEVAQADYLWLGHWLKHLRDAPDSNRRQSLLYIGQIDEKTGLLLKESGFGQVSVIGNGTGIKVHALQHLGALHQCPEVLSRRVFDVIITKDHLQWVKHPGQSLRTISQHCLSTLLIRSLQSSEDGCFCQATIDDKGATPMVGTHNWYSDQLKPLFAFIYGPFKFEKAAGWQSEIGNQGENSTWVASRRPLQSISSKND